MHTSRISRIRLLPRQSRNDRIDRKHAWLSATALVVALLVAGCAASEDEIVLPDVTPRPSDAGVPQSKIIDDFVGCMQERGWNAARDSIGKPFVSNTPEDQQEIMMGDSRECGELSGFTTSWKKESWTTEQLTALYKQELANHVCMLAIGLESNDPPSLQTYLDTWGTEKQYRSQDPGLDARFGQAAYNKAVIACPPPAWFFNLP